MGVFQKIIGDPNERVIKDLQLTVNLINEWGPRVVDKTPEELRQRTQEFKEEYQAIAKDKGIKAADNYLDEILPEAFAMVREASNRTLGQRHFDVQLIGGIILHRGEIAEMKTGEGKTLVATLPLYLNALSGQGVHLVTVNDYLAKIGAGWMGPIYNYLGVSVAVIIHEQALQYDPNYYDDSQFDERLSHFRPISRQLTPVMCCMVLTTNLVLIILEIIWSMSLVKWSSGRSIMPLLMKLTLF